mmetsp:Transcript_29548/g.45019  ORF Transcript_29548/g.45019 Transcript_29548/m.45019 type:complete len:255 (-) Transcript_29548:1137-1901(-)
MLDVMGVYQHHDAVAGTGKQAVAEDYSRLLAMATATNNEAYSETLSQVVQQQTGLEAKNLQECYKFNSTFVDCPVNSYDMAEGDAMTVVVHNPSSIAYEFVQVAIPKKKFKVSLFFEGAAKFVTLDEDSVDIHCHEDAIFTGYRNQTTVPNCQLFAKVEVPSRQVKVLQLQLVGNLDQAEPQDMASDSIESPKSKLTFLGSDEEGLSFSMFNKETETENKFQFSFKNWPSYVSYTTLENSGPYIFRPVDNLFEA